MKLSLSALTLASLFSTSAANASAEYVFDCGAYGDGEIKIDNGHFSIELDLENLDGLVANAGDTLGYHLHTTWINAVSSSVSSCGADVCGNHYDPTFFCGPASEAINSPQCSNADYKLVGW